MATAMSAALLGAVLAAPEPAAANDGPSARIWDLVVAQSGQDVLVSFGVSPASGSLTFSVRREPAAGGEGIDLDLEEGDNLSSAGEEPTEDCGYYSEPEGFYFEDLCSSHPVLCVDCDEDETPECFEDCEICPTWISCADVPALCTDCDGDGQPECTAGCEWAEVWEVIDRCVPPGSYTYSVFAETVVGSNTEAVDVEVDDFGYEDCASDTDGGDDPADDSDAGDPGGGCSVSGRPGAGGRSAHALLVMLISAR
jgi:hypothetical protein